MRLKLLLVVFLGLLAAPVCLRAQYDFDADITAIRTNAIPGFDGTSWATGNYGNYIQYLPAATLLGLKVSGLQGRTTWPRFLSEVAVGAALSLGVAQGLKYLTQRERPNGGPRSFPSGHSVLAFASATLLHHEYGWRSPWYSIGGYSVAMLTAIQRVTTGWHYMSDTMAGMALGIGCVELGYWLNSLMWKQKGLMEEYEDRDFLVPFASAWSVEWLYGTSFPLGDGADKAAGLLPDGGGVAGLQVNAPLHRFSRAVPEGPSLRLRASALSLRYKDPAKDHNRYSLLGGAAWTFPIDPRFGFDLYVLGGAGPEQKGSWAGDVVGGAGVSVITSDFYKLKLFLEADWWTPLPPAFHFGWSVAFCW